MYGCIQVAILSYQRNSKVWLRYYVEGKYALYISESWKFFMVAPLRVATSSQGEGGRRRRAGIYLKQISVSFVSYTEDTHPTYIYPTYIYIYIYIYTYTQIKYTEMHTCCSLFIFSYLISPNLSRVKGFAKKSRLNATSICDDANFAVSGQNTDGWFETRFTETLVHLSNGNRCPRI